jgi:hypothetical protein
MILRDVQWEIRTKKKDGLTRATTAISSAHAEGSPRDTCWRLDLMSSSIATSLITLLAAKWASCFAAVFLTEVDDPVSRRRRSRSNLKTDILIF